MVVGGGGEFANVIFQRSVFVRGGFTRSCVGWLLYAAEEQSPA